MPSSQPENKPPTCDRVFGSGAHTVKNIDGVACCTVCDIPCADHIQEVEPENQLDNDKEELRQKLASIEHERWADWQKWCHKVLREQVPYSPELELVLTRWDKQIETPYSGLSDKEKASDMEQVDRYWHLIDQYTQSKLKAFAGEFEEAIGKDDRDYSQDNTDLASKIALVASSAACNELRVELRQALKAIKERWINE